VCDVFIYFLSKGSQLGGKLRVGG